MTNSVSTRPPVAAVSPELRLEHVELPKQIVLLKGLVGGAVLGKIMLDKFAGELDTKALQSLATTLGGALSLNGAQTSRLATAVVAWAPALMLNSPGAWAGLVKVILQALPPDVRKRMPALGEIERGLAQGEQTARERWKELQKQLPDFSGRTLHDLVTQEVKRLADQGLYWAAFALQQLARSTQPGPSSAAARAKKSGAATANATPSLRDGWAAKTGPFKDVNIAEIRSLKGAPLEWLPEGMPRLAATMRLVVYADALVEKGELVKVKHEGHFNTLYREVKTGTLYRIGEVTAQELRAGLRASRVKPPIGPEIDFSRSLFVPFHPARVDDKATAQGPAVVAMQDLGGPTLQEALGKASPKQQEGYMRQVADVLAQTHLLVRHGDANTGNFVFDRAGRLRMIDFQVSGSNRVRRADGVLRPDGLREDLLLAMRAFQSPLVDSGRWTEAALIAEFKRHYYASIDRTARASKPPVTHPGLRQAMEAAFDQIEKTGFVFPRHR